MIGIGALATAALVICPVLAVGGLEAAAPVTTAALAAAGFADMQLGVGMLALFGALVGGGNCKVTIAEEQFKLTFKTQEA